MHPALQAFVRSQVAAEKRLLIKQWAASIANDPMLAFSVSEVRCSDPNCFDAETIILLMAEGRATRCARIAAPIDAVTRPLVNAALAQVLPSRAFGDD